MSSYKPSPARYNTIGKGYDNTRKADPLLCSRMYLDPSVRNGISSFSMLANQPEVEKGLTKLNIDINSGAINEIIQNAQTDKGDYCFIVAEKV